MKIILFKIILFKFSLYPLTEDSNYKMNFRKKIKDERKKKERKEPKLHKLEYIIIMTIF